MLSVSNRITTSPGTFILHFTPEHPVKLTLTLCLTTLLTTPTLAQQCTTGLVPMGYMGVCDENGSTSALPSARTNAMARWDPDGDGPQPELLVIGGAFRSIDGVPANSIAAWNGSTWQAIGNGFPNRATPGALNLNQDSEVTALTVHNGTLYAAGRLAFTTPDGAPLPLRIARWTGSTWEQVGLDNSSQGAARISSLQFAYGRLYVGGAFTYLYNGATSYAFGYYETLTPTSPLVRLSPISNDSQNNVRTMTVHNGELFVGGTIRTAFNFDNRVVRVTQNGSVLPTQMDCTSSCSGSAQQLLSTGNQLYLAGDYTFSNGTRRAVARYLGTNLGWEIIGTNPVNIANNIQVSIALDENANLVRSTGAFVERWDGSNWLPLGALQGGTTLTNTQGSFARLLGSFQGKPIIGGKFAGVQDGDVADNNIRFLESLAFVNSDGYFMPISQGIDNSISDMALLGNDIIAVGRVGSAGAQRCNNIAVFGSDNRWRPWAGNNGFERQTRSVAIYQGQPIVSGGYTAFGDTQDPFVRRWDGSQWIDMPPPPNGVVETFTVAGDELWAEVQPTRGGGSVPYVYRWNGTSWEESPAGRSIFGLQNCLGQVWGTRSGTIYSLKVMRWTGSVWDEVGPLTSSGKSLLGEYQGSVLALGFTLPIPNQPRTNMYRLVDNEWSYLGDFPTPRLLSQQSSLGLRTRRITQTGNLLIPSGTATGVDGFTYPAGAIWDGSGWSNTGGLPLNIPNQGITWVGSSLGGIPISRGNDVFLAGAFIGRYERFGAGSSAFRRATSYFTRLSPGWNSQFSPHEDFTVDPGDALVINSGATNFTAGNWRFNGALLSDGQRASGAFVSGATTQVLTITGMTQAEAGLYDFSTSLGGCVSTPIGSAPPPAAASARRTVFVSVANTCDSVDFNNDGSSPDPQDIEAFLSVFSEGPCVPDTATCNDIDFNNDASVFDPRDIESFLSVYSEGACL